MSRTLFFFFILALVLTDIAWRALVPGRRPACWQTARAIDLAGNCSFPLDPKGPIK